MILNKGRVLSSKLPREISKSEAKLYIIAIRLYLYNIKGGQNETYSDDSCAQ